MKISVFTTFIVMLFFSACASDSPKKGPKKSFEPKVEYKQFPDQSNGLFEYVVAINMPEVKGMTKMEAQKLKKFYVLNGLSYGLGALFSLTDPNLKEPRDVDSFFTEIKDSGKSYLTLVYAPTAEIGQNQYARSESSFMYLDTDTNRLSIEFRHLNQDPSIRPSTITQIKPNQKLSELFQSSGPNVSPALMEKMDNAIVKKLEPYDIRIVPGGPDEPTELTSLIQREANDEETIESKKPRWLTHVDKAEGSKIWAYLMLYAATIEPQPKTDQGMVLFKITVHMNEVLRLAKAEKYENFMAK